MVNSDSIQFVQWVRKNEDSWETAGVNEFYQLMKEAQYNEAYEMGIKLFRDNKINNNPKMAYTIGVLSLLMKKDNEQAIRFFEIANKDATYQDIAKEYFELAISRQNKK
jgi:tetratricopeptide (TPR) repeat protein